MSNNNDMIYKLLTRKYDFCCLCYKEIKDSPIQIEDEIIIKSSNGETTLRILEALEYILGSEVYDTISSFTNLCRNCTSSTVKSYKFIKTTKHNFEFINKCINGLSASLENSNDYFNYTKSMYITCDTKDFQCKQYYDYCQVNSTSSALERLNILIEQDNEKFGIKTEHEFSDFEIPTKPSKTGKRRSKHYVCSIPIKTNEMLYNKNDHSSIKCKTCLKIYPSLSNLRRHFIRVHAPKKYKCSMCNKKFGSLALVEAHQTECHVTLICKECGKTFNNRQSLKAHETGHYLRIVCPDCGRVYKSQATYKKHIVLNICGQKTRASPLNAKFTCDYCNKKYTQKVSLRVHIQYEHGNYKGHECKWCKKKFFAQSKLNAHVVKHTQEKKFTCATCGGKFVSKESLLHHTRIHTGEKPFKCEYCDKSFISASRRTDHRKRHHSNALYQCNICSIKCSTKIFLQEHMKIHDGQNKEMYAQTYENDLHKFSKEILLHEANY